MMYDSHMHTPLCKHARGEPEAYAAVAQERGLQGIIFTCHNPGPDGWSSNVRMDMAQFDAYVDLVARAREAWHGRVDVRLGLECDYIPGFEAWLEPLLQRADFHHVLGSIHPQLEYYRGQFDHGDARAYYATYFDHLARAAETGLFDTLAHPDLVKNVYHRQWSPQATDRDMRSALDRIARTGVAMELNTSGLHKTVREMNPSPHMLAAMRARDIPVVLGSDAHAPERVAADFDRALDLLEDAGYTQVSYFLGRERRDVPLETAVSSLIQTM